MVILRSREPVGAIAWILALMLMPGVGGVLYLAVGTTRIVRKTEKIRRSRATLGPLLPRLCEYEMSQLPGLQGTAAEELFELLRRTADSRPTRGNRVEVITDTNRAYWLQQQAIQAAKHHVHLEYYIFQPDETGRRFRDLLIEKARAGVEVRFLYDAVGSMRLTRRFLRPMWQAGIKVECFLPVNPLRRRWVFNLRNHRKLLVVDGEVGFTGGVNVGDEYVGRHYGYWRDTHLMLRGPAALQMQQVFAADWYFAVGEELRADGYYPAPGQPGDELVQIVSSGPDQATNTAQEMYFAAISAARQRVWIETCYFVPPQPILRALITAAHRGVDVRIIVPRRCAHLLPLIAAHSYYEELLAAGVELYQYDKGLMHAKTMSVDSCWATVGSTNLDVRSLELNFEVGAVFYGEAMAKRIEEIFEQDLARSLPVELDEWKQRGLLKRLTENTCRLFSPML